MNAFNIMSSLSHLIITHLSLQNNVIDQLQAISGVSCPYSEDDCFSLNLNLGGYYVATGQKHRFMDVTPGSLFMDSSNPWGLAKNFDWLAEEAYVNIAEVRSYYDYSHMNMVTSFPTSAITRSPTSAPTVKQSIWSRFKSRIKRLIQ